MELDENEKLLCERQCQKMRRCTTVWEKIFAKDTSVKDFQPKYQKKKKGPS